MWRKELSRFAAVKVGETFAYEGELYVKADDRKAVNGHLRYTEFGPRVVVDVVIIKEQAK